MAGSDKKNKSLDPKIINFIAIVVTFVWAGSFIADISSLEYNPPTQIHTVMLSIVGSIFGFQIAHGKQRGNGEG